MNTPVTVPNRHGDTEPGERLHVLYVDGTDDVPSVCQTIYEDDRGIQLIVCRSINSALDAMEQTRFDCVVSEHRFPEGTGIELLRAVREQSTSVPFVLFTDSGDERVASDAIGAGVTDYLPKAPLTEQTEVLCQRIQSAVTRYREETAILDRMTDAFFALDEDWEFTYLNEGGRRVICEAMADDASIEELLGRNIWDAVPSAVDTEFHDQYHRAMDEQESVSFEAYYEPLETWFEVSAYPSATGISVYFQDVTERRNQEQQLKTQEQALRETYRVIARKDMAFEAKVGRLLEIGQEVLGTETAALSRISGDTYTFEIVRDQTDTVAAGDTVPLSVTNCERAVVEEQTLVLADIERDRPELTERAGYTEMGVTCYLGTPVVVDGEVYGTFCFYDGRTRDAFSDWEITLVELMGNWVSYEQERERDKAELTRERNRLEDFASVVSHDLRNPLNVASGRLRFIADAHDGDPKHIDAVRRALDRMNELIDDALAFARGGHKVVDASETSLDEVLSAAWDNVESHGATLERVDTGVTVRGDRPRLQRVFENLFRNSVEHGSTGSQPGDEDSEGQAASESRAEGLTVRVGVFPDRRGFYVEDDGKGIPAAERDRVLEQGYTTSEGGTGFGLAIVSEIVEAHGGQLTATASDSGGARFEVTGIPIE